MDLPQDVEEKYIRIIDKILQESDLSTVSSKRVRKGLQAEVDYDISAQKAVIDQLITSRFDKILAEREASGSAEPVASPSATPSKPLTNGHASVPPNPDPVQTASPPISAARDDEDEELSDIVDDAPPKKKKRRKMSPTTTVDEDAKLAAKLQAEWNGGRPSRSTATRKAVPSKKRKNPVKGKTKGKGDDDSDIGSGDGEGKKRNVTRTGGFHKPFTLSAPLASFAGETSLSRPQTVKRIWDYVKNNGLQDPDDRRYIRCDDSLKAIFKADRIHMFSMNKSLTQHLYAQEE